MAQVSTLTGINAHTLRKWESRYSFVRPKRTDTNIRVYPDALLRKLLNISILQRNGYKISRIDKMSQDEIHSSVTEVLLKPVAGDELTVLTLSLIEMNEREFNKIINSHIENKGILAAVTDLIYPFLNQIGVLWGVNKIMPVQEHFISNLIRQKVIAGINSLPLPAEDAPKIILFLPEYEHHEIGLLLAQYIAKELGWNTYYLGQNVPIDNIEAIQKIISPDFLLTMFVTTVPDKIKNKIENILKQTTTKLIVTGNPINLETEHFKERTIYLSNPKQLVDLLKSHTFN